MNSKKFLLTTLMILSAVFLFSGTGPVEAGTNMATDAENCLLCHRYPNMGRYDKTGGKRIFYINEYKFARSVHGKLRCKNCHVGLDKIPHTDIKKVNCATKCHLTEPSTNREFSHINMVNKHDASVHGPGGKENPKPFADDLPTCKYCHDNRIYNKLDGLWGKSEALTNETLTRCMGCHTKMEWAQNFYLHFTHRMRRRRQQSEVVKLCTSCHEDREKMARHGLESIETYKDTFHWSQVKYHVENAPDCISCHVPVGYSTHEIRPRTDPLSPINVANRINTCSHQGGIQVCHPGATAGFATGRVHAYGEKAKMVATNDTKDMETPDRSRIFQRAMVDLPEEEVTHYRILNLLRGFYKVLIAVVIGSMCLHQFMDYLRIVKNRKKQKHEKVSA